MPTSRLLLAALSGADKLTAVAYRACPRPTRPFRGLLGRVAWWSWHLRELIQEHTCVHCRRMGVPVDPVDRWDDELAGRLLERALAGRLIAVGSAMFAHPACLERCGYPQQARLGRR